MIYEEYPHEITFQRLEKVPDGGGGYVERFTDYLTTEAFVGGITSREYYQAQQLQNPVDCNVYFPYRNDIEKTMRIIYENKVLTLKSEPIDQGGMHEILNLKCQVTGVLKSDGKS